MVGWLRDNAVGLASLAVASAGFVWAWASGVADAFSGHEIELSIAAAAIFLLGHFAGWTVRGWRDVRKEDRRADEVVRRRIESLDGERRRLLESVFAYGIAKLDWESRESVLMEGMAAMGLVMGAGRLVMTWQLTERCRRVMEEMEG